MGRASRCSLGPYILTASYTLYPFTAIRHLYRAVPVPAHAYRRQLTDRQLPILQQQRPISLRQDQNLSNECIAGNIAVEAKKPIIIVNSTTTITTHLLLHILFPAMSPAVEEELTCRKHLKPNYISMLRTTFYRAMRCMYPKMDASLTSLRASTTNTGSCKQLSISSLQKAVAGFTTFKPQGTLSEDFSLSCQPYFYYPFHLIISQIHPWRLLP